MTTCDGCGAPLGDASRFCGTCGRPVAVRAGSPAVPGTPTADTRPVAPPAWNPPPWTPPPAAVPGYPGGSAVRSTRPWGAIVAAGLVVLALGGAGMVFAARDRSVPAPVPPPPVPSPVVQPAAISAAEALRQQVDADGATVESLVGRGVPQLSSKREGDVVAGERIDDVAVLGDFRDWRRRVPTSVLTRSERFTSFSGQGYWVTVAAESFDSAEAANAWCGARGLSGDDCFAKRLSHTDGPKGNTRHR